MLGKMVSTEDTYKYHMQVQEAPTRPALKGRDGPLKASLKPARGRTSNNDSLDLSTSSISSGLTPNERDVGLLQINDEHEDVITVGSERLEVLAEEPKPVEVVPEVLSEGPSSGTDAVTNGLLGPVVTGDKKADDVTVDIR